MNEYDQEFQGNALWTAQFMQFEFCFFYFPLVIYCRMGYIKTLQYNVIICNKMAGNLPKWEGYDY